MQLVLAVSYMLDLILSEMQRTQQNRIILHFKLFIHWNAAVITTEDPHILIHAVGIVVQWGNQQPRLQL